MDSLLSRAADVVLKAPIKSDDFVDRLHYFVTVAILACFVVGTGLQEYVGKPINCWSPKDYHYDSYQAHINSYCWSHKLRYPKYETEAAENQTQDEGYLDAARAQPLVSFGTAFYRWVTLVFIVQACLFKIPNFIWVTLSGTASSDIKKIRDLVIQSQNAPPDSERRLKSDEVVAYFEDWITGYRSYRFKLIGKHSIKFLTVLFCLGKKSGNYLSSLYLCYKVMNILNVFGNMFLLTVFLDLNFWKYGIVVLNSVLDNGDWQDPYNFPRVLLCDFVVEGGSDVTHFQIQCTMSLNLLLEKIFVLEWFWFVFIFIITIANLIIWAVKIKPPCSTILFSKAYIKTVDSYPSLDIGIATMIAGSNAAYSQKNFQREFIEEYLRSDGVFILRLLELKCDRTLVADIVKTLWNRYRAMRKTALGSNLTLVVDTGQYGSSAELEMSKVDIGQHEEKILPEEMDSEKTLNMETYSGAEDDTTSKQV
ncbi:hypothetical protein Btru_008387 [Bulinus truncatus]|nr:hypothetical protein Btru_008387 [Bulinus truncatus]